MKTAGSWNQKFFDGGTASWFGRRMQTTASSGLIKGGPKMGCSYVLAGIIAAAGMVVLVAAGNLYRAAGRNVTPAVAVTAVIGLGLLALLGPCMGYARRLMRASAEEEARRAQFPKQPWKWKKQWQVRYIESHTGITAVGMWIFALFWNAISFPAAWIVMHDSNVPKAAYLVFLFPLIGLGILAGAIYTTVRWRKYGRTRFIPSTWPGNIGGYLGGVIEVPVRVTPEAEARLQLKCVRRETRGTGKQRRTTENVLWAHEELIARDKWVTGLGGTQIPVLFYIPPESAGTDDSDRNNEIVWRLTAEAAVPGVDFSVQFVVPVFATGETAPPPEAGQPLLEAYSGEPLNEAGLKQCGVRREGDTFYFNASHLPGTRITTAVLTLGLLGLLVSFVGRDIHGVVWAVTIFFGLIIALFALDVWCAGFELQLESRDVVVTKRRPWGTKVTRMPRAEVREVLPEKCMSAGDSQYFRLSLVGAEGIDPAQPPLPGESFRARKLRQQMEPLQKEGQSTAETIRQLGSVLAKELSQQPKFIVPFAKHIPGQTKAEAIGAQVLAAIRGSIL